MVNNLSRDQIMPQQLAYLAARQQLYRQINGLLGLQILLTLASPLFWAIFIAIEPHLAGWAAFWSIGLSLLDAAILDPTQKSRLDEAARVQELFDCTVLQLPWNNVEIGSKPDAERITELARQYKTRDPQYERLKDWYPVSAGQLPMPLARLVCQRSNNWWDATQRREYMRIIVILLIILSLLVFALGMINGMTIERFVLVVLAPLSPAFLWGIREYRRQREAAELSERLKALSEVLWDKELKKQSPAEEILREARELQNGIYGRRKAAPPFPGFIYSVGRNQRELRMQAAAEDLVREWTQSVTNLPPP